jgi:hypothetical protein
MSNTSRLYTVCYAANDSVIHNQPSVAMLVAAAKPSMLQHCSMHPPRLSNAVLICRSEQRCMAVAKHCCGTNHQQNRGPACTLSYQ